MAQDSGGGNGPDSSNRSVGMLVVRALNNILVALQSNFVTTVGVSTVAGLPPANAAGQGARRTVTDANGTTFNSVVVGGGTNIVPCFSTGTQWRIG